MVWRNGGGWGQLGVSQGDGIQTAPGEGMATRKAAEGQPGAFDEAESDEGNIGIFGTGGEIEALCGAEGVENRRYDGPVETISNADGEAGLRIWHRVSWHWVV